MKVLLIAIDRVPHMGYSFRTALQQLGHEVRLIDERWAYTWLDRKPGRWLAKRLFSGQPSGRFLFRMMLLRACSGFKPDLVLAIKGAPLDRQLLEELRLVTNAPFAMYSTDNPFNPAVSNRFMIEALPMWNLIATPRRGNIKQLGEHCKGEIIYLPFGYDPALHHPEQPRTSTERAKFASDIVFVGACDADRVPFLDPLAKLQNTDVHLYGGYYRYTEALRKCDRGYVYGRAYRLVINTTSVAVCLVRKANGDGHVMRTYEIPACGAFQLAERTPDHCEMFEQDKEAVFFSSPEELTDKAHFYVRNESLRRQIAQGGHRRATEGKNSYQDRLRTLMQHFS